MKTHPVRPTGNPENRRQGPPLMETMEVGVLGPGIMLTSVAADILG